MIYSKISKKNFKKDVYYLEGDYIWEENKLFGWRSKTKKYSVTLELVFI